jgi:NADPH:quinone reductase-like Zn-dependent oxidoreductase
MKALVYKDYGGPEVMALTEIPDPQTTQRDVKVRVYAAGLNPVDFKIRNGQFRRAFKFNMPLVAGFDVSGVVTEVGLRARHFEEGDRVFAFVNMGRPGTCMDTVCIDRSDVAPMPKSLSFDQAAGVPLAALTAWQALVDAMKLQSGQEILIHAGAGGVGTFAIQFARHMGARVTATASAGKHALLKELGAAECIDYTKTNFTTLGPKFHAVFDTVGEKTLIDSFKVVKPGGKVVSIVSLPDDAAAKRLNMGLVARLFIRHKLRPVVAAARAAKAEYRWFSAAPSEAQLRRIAELIDQGHVKVIMDSVHPLDNFREAFAKLESGHATGKIVLRIRAEEAPAQP